MARLLVNDHSSQTRFPSSLSFLRGSSEKLYDYEYETFKDERKADPKAMERFTNFLLGGHIDVRILKL